MPAVAGLVCAVLLTFASPALAVPFVPDLLVVEVEGVGTWEGSTTDLGCVDGTGTVMLVCDGMGQTYAPSDPNMTWELFDWMLMVDSDPIVTQNFGFRNTGPTQTFNLVTTATVGPLVPSSLMGGSTGGSVTDADFNGAGGLSTVTPDAFYVGLIDGAAISPSTELHPDPFSVTLSISGETKNIPNVNFGLPGPTVPGPAVTNTIGIRNRFSLSGGDSVSSSNFFQVEVVPEPGTASLLGLGLAGLAILRRRRAAG
jgi:hypothetical protein